MSDANQAPRPIAASGTRKRWLKGTAAGAH